MKIQWVQDFMPALGAIRKQFEREKPFAGKKIAMSIHMEAKTAYLALVLKAAGAEVYATGCNPLSTQHACDTQHNACYRIYCKGRWPAALQKIQRLQRKSGKRRESTADAYL